MNRYKEIFDLVPENPKVELLATEVRPEPEPRAWVRTVGTLVATCMITAMIWGAAVVWNTHTAPEEDPIGSAVGSGEEQEIQEDDRLTELSLLQEQLKQQQEDITQDQAALEQKLEGLAQEEARLQDEIWELAPLNNSEFLPEYGTASNGLPLYNPYKITRPANEDERNAWNDAQPKIEDYMFLDDEYTSLQTVEEIVALSRESTYAFMRERYFPELYSMDVAENIVTMALEKADEGFPAECDLLERARALARWEFARFLYFNRIGDKAYRPDFLPEAEIPFYDGTNGDLPVLRYKLEDAPTDIGGGSPYSMRDYPGRFWYGGGISFENGDISPDYGSVRTDRILGYSLEYRDAPDRPNHDMNIYLFYLEGDPGENADEYYILSVKKEPRTAIISAINTFAVGGTAHGITVDSLKLSKLESELASNRVQQQEIKLQQYEIEMTLDKLTLELQDIYRQMQELEPETLEVNTPDNDSRSSLDYRNLTDEFTPLQTIEDILDKANQMQYEYLIAHNRPERLAKDSAMAFEKMIYQNHVERLRAELEASDDLEWLRALVRFELAMNTDSIFASSNALWESRIDLSETEMPWYNGTNADAPVVRYRLEDAPEEIQATAAKVNFTEDGVIVDGEKTDQYSATFDIDGRLWGYYSLQRNDVAVGCSTEEIDGFPHTFVFYLDQEQEQTDSFLIFSMSVKDGGGSICEALETDDPFGTISEFSSYNRPPQS